MGHWQLLVTLSFWTWVLISCHCQGRKGVEETLKGATSLSKISCGCHCCFIPTLFFLDLTADEWWVDVWVMPLILLFFLLSHKHSLILLISPCRLLNCLWLVCLLTRFGWIFFAFFFMPFLFYTQHSCWWEIYEFVCITLHILQDVGNYKGVKLVTGQELFSHHLILAPTFVIPPCLTTPSVSPQDVY